MRRVEDPTADLVILHVDDDPMNLRVVAEILTAFGFRSVQAGSGEQALAELRARRFDAVLMDIHMPGLGGVEVTRRIRDSLGAERDTPVIALTADAVSRTRAQYLALGFDDFVTKPILVSRLLRAILSAVAKGQERALRKAG